MAENHNRPGRLTNTPQHNVGTYGEGMHEERAPEGLPTHADPHPPVAERAAGRFHPDQGRARLAFAGAGGDEGGRFPGFLRAVIVELAGKRALAQQGGKGVQQALVSGASRYLGFHQIRSRSLQLAGPAGVARL